MDGTTGQTAAFELDGEGGVVAVVGRVVRVEGVRADCVLDVAGAGEVHAALVDCDLTGLYALTCDHRVSPPRAGLVRGRDLDWNRGDEDDPEPVVDLDAEALVPLWAMLLDALDAGDAELPEPDAAFPGAFAVAAEAVDGQGELGSADFAARYPEPPDEAQANWDADCPIRVRTSVDGHHVAWEVVDTDSSPLEPTGHATGWATFPGGTAVTTFHDDIAIPAYLAFSAPALPDDPVELAAWRVALGYAILTVAGLSVDESAGRSGG